MAPKPAAQGKDLARLAELVQTRQQVTAAIEAQVDLLAAAGTPWPAIASMLGVSRQAARQAHTRRHQDRPARRRAAS